VSDLPPIGPLDSSRVPRFAGFATFARLPRIDEVAHADVAVVGVPFDSGVSYRPGARFGPAAAREASRLLRPYHPALDVSPFAERQVVDAGDIAANPFHIGEAIEKVQQDAEALMAGGTRLVTVGGDHTIALPLLRATAKKHGPVALLHFDAHLDTWDTYFGEPYTHGTPFRRAVEEGILDTAALSHVGTRGPLYGKRDLGRTSGSASASSPPATCCAAASTRPSTRCASGSVTGRCTSRWTSTCSTPRTHPAPARPRRAG
jgi:agmatinase